jgi:hypothetical protein
MIRSGKEEFVGWVIGPPLTHRLCLRLTRWVAADADPPYILAPQLRGATAKRVQSGNSNQQQARGMRFRDHGDVVDDEFRTRNDERVDWATEREDAPF